MSSATKDDVPAMPVSSTSEAFDEGRATPVHFVGGGYCGAEYVLRPLPTLMMPSVEATGRHHIYRRAGFCGRGSPPSVHYMHVQIIERTKR